MKKKIHPLSVILVLFLLSYSVCVLIKQEIEIKKYEKEKQSYIEQIAISKKKNLEYKKYSQYVNTNEYIEKIAREKLGMLLPEERIYIEYNG